MNRKDLEGSDHGLTELPSMNLPRETAETHGKPGSGYRVTRKGFEPSISRDHVKGVSATTIRSVWEYLVCSCVSSLSRA
jgi:hypothetical protein